MKPVVHFRGEIVEGKRSVWISVEDEEWPLKPLRYGFAWGYSGTGPHELARALLAHALPLPVLLRTAGASLENDFIRDFISRWPGARPWSITSTEIQAWAGSLLAKQSHTSGVGGSESARQRPSAVPIKSPAGGTGKSTAVEAEGGRKEARH